MEEEQKQAAPEGISRSINPRTWGIAAVVAVVILLTLSGSAWAYAGQYEGKIYPGISVGGIDIGGKTVTEASILLQEKFQTMLLQGERIEIEGNVARIDLEITNAEDADLSYGLLSFDADKTAQDAFDVNRAGNRVRRTIGAVSTRLLSIEITPTISAQEEQLSGVIRGAFPTLEQPGADTDFAVTWDDKTPTLTVVPGTTGTTIDTAQAIVLLVEDARDFTMNGIQASRATSGVTVNEQEAASLIPQATIAIENAPFTLSYTGSDKKDHTWTIDAAAIADWLRPAKTQDGTVAIALDNAQVTDWLKQVHGELDIAAQDAVFIMEGEKVTTFKGSQEGVSVDDAATTQALVDALATLNATATVAVTTVEPTVSTESVNNLGIKEILGVGYSNYGRSPGNRIKNIAHGSSKINGMLIAPGETVSAIENLAPFTLEDGYFPELVILGDKITPEIGGGLCQIGTTLFRAAMNSGLEILERRNHSLTVSYYNDPSNNQPGTDATLYEPNPDLKFKNTTGNYILLMTDVNQTTGDLYFTFWGTSDGRKAWYDPPTVLSKSGAGADRITYTDTLAPGVEKCQASHYGASTTFTYHILAEDGTETLKEFPSYYRPLPKICLVGGSDPAAPAAEETADDGTATTDPATTPTDSTDSSATPESAATDPETVPAT